MLPPGTMVDIGGGTPAGAEQAAARLIARGARALISFGLAGGLDPALRAGALVVAEAVVEAGVTYPTHAALTDPLPRGGLAFAAPAILATQDKKRAAHAATGAAVVDLESGAVARVAGRHGLPFAVVRAVSDPADRPLPPAALVALDARGRIAVAALLGSLLHRPGQIAALVALARATARARASLEAAAHALRPSVSLTAESTHP
jgi:adenosylhomocysteine nucleosidase